MQLKPDHFGLLNDRGNVLLALGRLDEALASYDRALALKPDFLDALNNRGHVLQGLRRPADALMAYDRALAIQSDHAIVLNNRGNALQALRRHHEALASYDGALASRPDYAEALNNRAGLLLAMGRASAALADYDRALASKPDYVEALNNRGTALRALGRFEQALVSYEQALAIKPDYAEAHNNRGTVLRTLGRGDDALASFDRALALRPNFPQALLNRGNALSLMRRYEKAIPDYQSALREAPHLRGARGALMHAKLQCCQWSEFQKEYDLLLGDVRAGEPVCSPFIFLGLSSDPAEQLRCSREWARRTSPMSNRPVWRGETYSHDRVRVAYISADYRDHPVAQLLIETFERHDRRRIETVGVSLTPDLGDPMFARMSAAFDRLVSVHRKTDQEVANLLREMEIDVAVDLMGFTQFNRMGIFAQRPAPIQVGYLGFIGSTGTEYIDYILTDHFVIPREQQAKYTEKVVYLPDTFQSNPSRRPTGRIPTRTEAGLPEAAFVFCSFNNNYKITPQLFDIWMRLLIQVEDSVLWLLINNAEAERNLRHEARSRGVSPDRLIFASRVGYADYLARFSLADLFLDTLPHNACTTASDALWSGLPILTCAGEAYAARMAGSLLHTMELSQLVTSSLQDYEALALRLARDPHMLAELRDRLAHNRGKSALFDTQRFCRHLEGAFSTMVQRHRRGERPASFSVEPVS